MQAYEAYAMTAHDVARYFKVATRTVYRWVRDGELPAINVSTDADPRYRFRRSDVEAFAQGRKRLT